MTYTLKAGKHKNIFVTAMFSLLFFGSSQALTDQHPFHGDLEKYKMGKKVFSNYCSRCHGKNADGRGETIPMYLKMNARLPSNFKVRFYSIRPRQYLANIVRDGGQKHSLSKYMPPFGGELDKQQINDVVYFIQNVSLYSSSPRKSVLPANTVATGQD